MNAETLHDDLGLYLSWFATRFMACCEVRGMGSLRFTYIDGMLTAVSNMPLSNWSMWYTDSNWFWREIIFATNVLNTATYDSDGYSDFAFVSYIDCHFVNMRAILSSLFYHAQNVKTASLYILHLSKLLT